MSTVTDVRHDEPRRVTDYLTVLQAADLHDLADALDSAQPIDATVVAAGPLGDCEFCPADPDGERFDAQCRLVVTWHDGHQSRDDVCPGCIRIARHWHLLDGRVAAVALEIPATDELAAQLRPGRAAA